MLAVKRILQYVKKETSNCGIIYPKNAEVCLVIFSLVGEENNSKSTVDYAFVCRKAPILRASNKESMAVA